LKAVYPLAKPNNNQNQEILSPYGIEWNPDFSTLQGKQKFGSKIQVVQEIRGKITVFHCGEGNNF